ncbi:MAG: response regulator [Rickettsiales bacterium]|nr:response regulator [Rickettsiales bacterium]
MTTETKVKKSPFSVLFVDDEDQARKYFEKGLKNDFNVMLASSVDEAQTIIKQYNHSIAVVITDQRMPGGNGVKLLTFLRENYPHIIRLLTTAYSDLADAIEAVNSGEILRYIQKPWDYNMLKSEVRQALELFELRLERNQMMYEKIMVKRKMAKVERVKALMLLAKSFSFLNSADIAVNNFIKEFTQNINDLEDERDFESFDFGNQDVLETKFMLDLFTRIQQEISLKNNYNFDEEVNSDSLKLLFENLNKNTNSNLQINVSEGVVGKVSSSGFSILAKKLLELAASSKSVSSIAITKAENGFAITLNAGQILLEKNSNLFVVNPSKVLEQFYVDILMCYVIAAHHGGVLEYSFVNDNLSLNIKLPNNPENSLLPKRTKEEMDNVILSVML